MTVPPARVEPTPLRHRAGPRRAELARVPLDIAPPDNIQFTTIGGVPFGADEGDVAGGMVATACTSAGLALAKAMGGWAPSLDAAVSRSAAR